MRRLDVGPLPVCEGERLVGMLTDRNITVQAVAEGRDPRTTKVQDVMTREVTLLTRSPAPAGPARCTPTGCEPLHQ